MGVKLVIAGLGVMTVVTRCVGNYFKRATERLIMKQRALSHEMQTIYRFRRE